MRFFCILALCVLPLAGATTTQILGGTWAELNAGTGTAALRSLAESGGNLIAVGDKGFYEVSDDNGTTWTQATTLNVDGDDKTLTCNFYDILNVNERLILVGAAPATLLVSDDGGATWTNGYPDGVIGAVGLRAVVSIDDADLVAVGSSGGVIESLDGGDTWAQVKPGNSGGYLAVASDGADGLVAVGVGGIVMSRVTTTSTTDGTTTVKWTLQTSGTTKDLYGIAYDGSNFVAVGSKGTIITSPDGVTWTDHSVPAIDGTFPFFTDVTTVNSLLITSGTSIYGFRYSSDSGATWTQSKVTPFGSSKVAGGSMQDLAVTSKGVYSVGLKGEVWYSDGSYELWIQQYGLSDTDAAETADPDGDGLTNFTEWVLGLDPVVPATPEEKAVLPAISVAPGGVLSAVFTLPTNLPAGVTATIERATKLAKTTLWTTFATRTATGDWVLTTATTPSPIGTVSADGKSVTTVALGNSAGFFRLKFTR